MKKLVFSMACLLLIGATPILTACTEELERYDQNSESNCDISYLKFNIQNDSWTRGTMALVSSLDDGFGVSSSTYPAAETYTSYACGNYFYNIRAFPNADTGYYWPLTSNEISFFAYYPYGNANLSIQSSTTTGSPIYAYSTPINVASQIDVMTAQVTDVSCAEPTTSVSLTFGHKCSDLRFILDNSTNETVTVNSLTVKNFYRIGTLQENTWTTTGDVQDFVLTVENDVASGTSLDLTGTTNHFILIPQTITSGARLLDLYVTSGGENKHFYCDLAEDYTAEAGKTYQFRLLLKSNLEVDDGTGISDWELQVGYINYATGINTENWTPEEQPIERIISGGISDWQREN